MSETVTITISEGVGPRGATGATGAAGSDADVTNANVNTAIESDPAATRASLGVDDYVNVMLAPYNATGDGSTDDTAAIQAAMDSGKSVFFPVPSSYYKITAGLEIPRDGLYMWADGFGQVKIKQVTTGENGIEMSGNYSYFRMEGLRIEGPGSGTSTATGVDLTPTSTFTLRHDVHRCIVTDFQKGLVTGDTVLFKASHIQISSNVTDIDLTDTDTALIDSFGTGTSYGGGATGNLGIKTASNHAVVLTNIDAGNADRFIEVGAGSTVEISGWNIENVTEDGAVTIKPGGILDIKTEPRILGDPDTATDAFILLDCSSGASVPSLSLPRIAPPSDWRAVVARGTYRYFAMVAYHGRQYSVATKIYYQASDGGSVDTERCLGTFPIWHATLTTGFPNNDSNNLARIGTQYYAARRDDVANSDDSAGMYLKNRFNTVSKVDFNVDNHQRVIATSSAAVGNSTTTETELMSESLAANTLLKAGERVVLTATGVTAANGNNKTLKVKLGANTLFDSGALALNDQGWRIVTTIKRNSATDWVASTIFSYGTTVSTPKPFEGSTSLAGALDLEIIGQATADDDVECMDSDIVWRKGDINP